MYMIDKDIGKAAALVIDGNPTSRNILTTQLRDLGVGQISQTGRVNEARLSLEARPYDIVLCDYHFETSDMSGQDLLDELRREQILPHSTVFIMVTGEATYAKVVEAAESALDGYLLKPYSAASLGERLTEARRRKRVLKDIFDAMERGETERAILQCAERFRARTPYWQFAARMGAELMLKLNRAEGARQMYEEMIKAKATPWAKLGMVRAQFAAAEMGPARRGVETLIREAPDHADAYDVLGCMQVDQGELGAALATFRTVANMTPGCLLRLQHCGTLAFYEGQRDEAQRMLERTVAMGLKSKLFDPLTLVLVACLRHDDSDSKGLVVACEHIARLVQRQPESTRLRRFDLAARALRHLLARQPDEAWSIARELAAQASNADFDIEAANVVLALWTRLPEAAPQDGAPVNPEAAGIALADTELGALLRTIAMRFCISKAVTEVLVASARKLAQSEALIRACQAEVTTIAETAMALAVRGRPRAAVQALLEQGGQTRNAKLIEMAGLVVRRHQEAIEDSAQLITEAGDMQRRYCQPMTHIAGIRRTGRSPGGLMLRS